MSIPSSYVFRYKLLKVFRRKFSISRYIMWPWAWSESTPNRGAVLCKCSVKISQTKYNQIKRILLGIHGAFIKVCDFWVLYVIVWWILEHQCSLCEAPNTVCLCETRDAHILCICAVCIMCLCISSSPPTSTTNSKNVCSNNSALQMMPTKCVFTERGQVCMHGLGRYCPRE